MSLALLIHSLGWAILHSLWKDTLVVGAAALALRHLRHASPQLRYLLACVALLLCLLIPVLDSWRGIAAFRAAAQWLASTGMAAGEVPVNVTASTAGLLAPALPWIVAMWISGVLAMLLRLCLGVAWVSRLGRSGNILHDTQWTYTMARLSTRLGVATPVALCTVAQLVSPVTTGWRHPIILIPAALLAHMSPDMLEALLAHELAHIKRRDYLINLLQCVVEALLFYHPLVWWLSRRIRAERELVADALAAQALGEGRRLALALEALDQHERQQARLAQAANGGHLLGRIRQLLRPGKRTRGWRGAVPLATVLLVSLAIHALSNAPERAQQPTPTVAAVPRQDDEAMASLAAQLHSSHALVLDDDTGNVLLQKDAAAIVPIASITKLLTAMVVLDAEPDLHEFIHVERQDVDSLDHRYSKLPIGTTLARGEVLKLALVASDNRAASALARSYHGGMPAFLAAARRKISTLGLTHTTIEEPTGRSYNNRSTALELAALARAASRYPDIARLTATANDEVAIHGKSIVLHNTNSLVGDAGWEVLVSKTGLSRLAGGCLVMRVKAAERHLTLVLLNAERPAARIEDAADILHKLAAAPPPA